MQRNLFSRLWISPFLLFSTLTIANEKVVQQPTIEQANTFINDSILPPIQAWSGASEALLLSPEHPWATPFEQQNYQSTPNYQDTMAWLDNLVDSSDLLHKVSLGKSPQGRDIWMIVASAEGAQTAKQLGQNGKATILVQAGIHSGEIDGKDAGMMLLRDISHGNKRTLLENVNLLFVPILSVDAHERSSEYNRVNQRGPINMGWRTTANNLNLNRDYAKADAIEMQHLIHAINIWQPHLYIDVHVTDGIDYQYDVTFGYNVKQGYSPSSFNWLENIYRPEIEAALTQQGHIPGPLVFALDNTDMAKGISLWNPSPRYSNGYGDARHLPTILIENHSLKPYKQRVLGTYVMLEQTLKTVGQNSTKLKSAINDDKYRNPSQLTLSWQSEQLPEGIDFKGINYHIETSPISGADVVRWTGEPKLYANIPVVANTKADVIVSRPIAYYIPPQWNTVIERLSLHGIRMTRIEKSTQITAQQYHFSQPVFSKADYEGRQTVTANTMSKKVTASLPAGTMRVATDQPLGDLAMLLLEPQAEDSLFYWGFFNTIFTQTEYIEDYAVEPLAEKMLAESPKLQAEFAQALKDPEFAKDSKARLRWFYQRSPYYDTHYLIYPVLRAMK
ncbi:carboxypeptidase [Shewanella inventionis]|uniref:Peptidase M14 n=1 Tax=Shewanella inventionis TaxID=1738770 RepID=A0ABQ1JP19_9GAMM|nr:M14 family metallopeptidase [Shewanella inventionis]MCL1159131.1 M14 family metallopeptidase [Shewanella inventionis]UAL43805.1 carboxypeptidase [Shewanella inventionis]GGB71556.1 peptidase M14 [Shewanella inventionis]